MAKLVLLGNSVNRLGGGAAWIDVLSDLAAKADLLARSITGKPLPIVYEYVVSRTTEGEQALKTHLATSMRRLRPNSAHERALTAAGGRLLTTNYDYCFELAGGGRRRRANLDRETTYSAFRRVKVGGREIWYMHGELDAPRTIMLGLHQYAGYLQKLRAYLTARPKTSPFRAGVVDFEHLDTRFSWVDLFLRDDVHIGGLTMDYVEIHLWWLIAYKLRLRRDLQCGTTHFYHFRTPKDGAGVQTRLEMLRDLGAHVHQVPVRANDWNGAHDRMFDQIADA